MTSDLVFVAIGLGTLLAIGLFAVSGRTQWAKHVLTASDVVAYCTIAFCMNVLPYPPITLSAKGLLLVIDSHWLLVPFYMTLGALIGHNWTRRYRRVHQRAEPLSFQRVR